MFKMKKMVLVVFMIVAFSLVTVLSLEVKATDETNPIDLQLTLDDTATPSNDTNVTDTNQETNTEEPQQVVQPELTEDTNTEENDVEVDEDEDVEDETLPQTGVTEDITVMFFIVVCAISAIYAYKKVNDYKVK